MKSFICLFAILFCFACTPKTYGPLGNVDGGMPNEPGKCYAKCKSAAEYEKVVEEQFIYTGEPIEAAYLEYHARVTQEAATRWSKKSDKNCLSADPKDCLVWCLVEVPEVTEEYFIVTDTTQTSEYRIETVEYKNPLTLGGETEWKEVVCQGDLNKGLINQIGTVLLDQGYYNGVSAPNKMNMMLTKALVDYQKEHGLSSGQLTTETLDHMGIQH